MRVSDRVSDLGIVLDHLPSLEPTPETRDAYEAVLSELQKRPNIFAKLSAVIHSVNGTIATDLSTHRARLDHLTEIFGQDRVLFGSDWPNSDGSARLDQVVSIVKEYFAIEAAIGCREILLEELRSGLQMGSSASLTSPLFV